MNTLQNKRLVITAGIVAVLLGAGGGYWYMQSQADSTVSTNSQATSIDTDSESTEWSNLPTTNITLSDEPLTISDAGTYILSGSSTAGVTVNSDGNVRLVLNGATINSADGAAIDIKKAAIAVIETADGSENSLADGTERSNEESDAVIYTTADVTFTGSGTLTIDAHFKHGVMATHNLTIDSGTYTISSDAGNAIKADLNITINGGTITIPASEEGLEAPLITINDSSIDIYATDDGINGSESDLHASPVITINGGNITVKVAAGDTDAIDSNGDLIINGGTIDLTGQSTIDYDGTGAFNGGTLILNGQEATALPTQMMGGGQP